MGKIKFRRPETVDIGPVLVQARMRIREEIHCGKTTGWTVVLCDKDGFVWRVVETYEHREEAIREANMLLQHALLHLDDL